jgi:hypothetical protein
VSANAIEVRATGAVRLYEQTGMSVVRRHDTYEKRL